VDVSYVSRLGMVENECYMYVKAWEYGKSLCSKWNLHKEIVLWVHGSLSSNWSYSTIKTWLLVLIENYVSGWIDMVICGLFQWASTIKIHLSMLINYNQAPWNLHKEIVLWVHGSLSSNWSYSTILSTGMPLWKIMNLVNFWSLTSSRK
jgi:hypothetical protein